MHRLQTALDDLERARNRKEELTALMINLTEQYRLVKQEVKMHEKRVEAMTREREYADYVDTMQLEKPLKFPVE